MRYRAQDMEPRVEGTGPFPGDPLRGYSLPGPSMASYFQSFAPAPPWNELGTWPPDVFALANLVLDYTEAYRLAVAPPPGRSWPPQPDWNRHVVEAASLWRDAAGRATGAMPPAVARYWDVVTRYRDIPMVDLRQDESWELWEALLSLHALADESCAGLAAAETPEPEESFERRAWRLLADHGSLSRLSPARVRVTPKTHFAGRGITIRSFSRYLALAYEAVDLRWRRIELEVGSDGRTTEARQYNVLLMPWPLQVSAHAFRPVEGPLENMDPQAFGFFEFVPDKPFDFSLLEQLLRSALLRTERVDAVILPEAAVEPGEIPDLESLLAEHGVTFLFAGVRERATADGFGRNYLHLGVHTPDGWETFDQDKHHRWCLDEAQIRQYHLTRVLDPGKQWWEAIELPPRMLQIIDVGGGATTAPLVCEDLARMDEVTDLLRRIGPSVLVTVLLDGPQLPSRWPCRYAAVLADEPGSAVLTLTAFGMAARSRPKGHSRSRVVGLWQDPTSGRHEIELGRGASGILITTLMGVRTVWTADGRRHDNMPDVVLSSIHQLRVPGATAQRGETSVSAAGRSSVGGRSL